MEWCDFGHDALPKRTAPFRSRLRTWRRTSPVRTKTDWRQLGGARVSPSGRPVIAFTILDRWRQALGGSLMRRTRIWIILAAIAAVAIAGTPSRTLLAAS